MSAVSDAKARLGYRQQGRMCEGCIHQTEEKDRHGIHLGRLCTLGGFTVNILAVCDSWADHTKPMLAKMEGEK